MASLEDRVRETQAAQASVGVQVKEEVEEREKITKAEMRSMLDESRKTFKFEERFDAVREEWSNEKDSIDKARQAAESKIGAFGEGSKNARGKVELSLAGLTAQISKPKSNGFMPSNNKHTGEGGLVTPPSPHSLSVAES